MGRRGDRGNARGLGPIAVVRDASSGRADVVVSTNLPRLRAINGDGYTEHTRILVLGSADGPTRAATIRVRVAF